MAIKYRPAFSKTEFLQPVFRPRKRRAAGAVAHREDGTAPVGLLARLPAANVASEPARLAGDGEHTHATAIADVERVLIDTHKFLGCSKIVGAHVLQ